jgi:hypothetical protein
MASGGAGIPCLQGLDVGPNHPRQQRSHQMMGKFFKRVLEWKALKALFRGGQASGRSQARRTRW